MYKPIIEVFRTRVRTQIEDEIIKAVHNVGVLVDKEELLKALKYDREQYTQGYEDGLNASKWIPCSEGLPTEDGEYLCQTKTTFGTHMIVYKFAKNLYKVNRYDFNKRDGAGFYSSDAEWGYYKVNDVVAWMPLPHPYEGGSE